MMTASACGKIDLVPADGGPGEIWQPAPGTTWQWQLTGRIDLSYDVEMYDIDLFDAATTTIAALHADDRIVICYFSAGTRENWRPDADDFATSDIGNTLADYPNESWVDIRAESVRQVMRNRLDLAVTKGCDGVEPDNVMGVDEDTGFPLSEGDQLAYNRFLAAEAHDRGLSVGLKNAVSLAQTLEPDFDWALNEECWSYDECDALAAFIDADKAVFHVEYVDNRSDGPALRAQVCGAPAIEGFSTLIKTWDLDEWQLACE